MPSISLTQRQDNLTGSHLRDHRRNRGLSPEQFGMAIGVSGRTIRRVEEGHRPTVRTMFLIAQEMCSEVSELWPTL